MLAYPLSHKPVTASSLPTRRPSVPSLNEREKHLGRLIKNIISVMHITSTDAKNIVAESTQVIKDTFPTATEVISTLDTKDYTKETLFESFKLELKKKHL